MTSADDDVKYACENVDSYRFPNVVHNATVYKNKFCVLCNSIKEHDVVGCQVSSSFTNLLNKTCQEFPRTTVCSNYRNIFCEMCHQGSSSICFASFENENYGGTIEVPIINPPIFTGAFMSMFSILSYEKEHEMTTTTSCQTDQMLDPYYVSVPIRHLM